MTQPAIFPAMVKVARSIQSIGKNQKNTHFRFNFRGIDDVYNALQPLLAEAGIFCTAKIISESGEEIATKQGKAHRAVVHISYTFMADDGSSVETQAIGEAFDTGDKSIGKAFSYAHKVALLQTFTVPTENAEDPDKHGYNRTGGYTHSKANWPKLVAIAREIGLSLESEENQQWLKSFGKNMEEKSFDEIRQTLQKTLEG